MTDTTDILKSLNSIIKEAQDLAPYYRGKIGEAHRQQIAQNAAILAKPLFEELGKETLVQESRWSR